ncbi:MAG: D-arabinose 5-phosphate isomerase [Flavobacteriaceae bacterium]|nr:D-arabinose 5-phosphate isomerase [Flavobacteriaceae bacterium]
MNKKDIKKISEKVIKIQQDTIEDLKINVADDVIKVIQYLAKIDGKIIVTGIGKSALVGMKVAATLNSTGSPSVFMHGSDALHGDMGVVSNKDVVIIISKSGNNRETIELVKNLKKNENVIIGLSSNKDSFLAKNSNYLVYTPIKKEACPHNLAPTTSSIIQMLVGDIIAISLMKFKNFDEKSFAKFHPSGSLGKKLTLTVFDILDDNLKPMVYTNDTLKKAIDEISSKMLGATVIMNQKKIVGIITDGDVRRILSKYRDPLSLKISTLVNKQPLTIDYKYLAVDALRLMNSKKISQLIVTKGNEYIGLVHIHQILKSGI